MHYNTAIITFVVGANALKLNSRLETEDFGSDFVDFFNTMGEGIVDAANIIGEGLVDAGEYIGSADGLSQDLETFGKTITSAEFWEQDMKNVGEAIISGEVFVDGYNWMADGSNWEALGKVIVGTGANIISGDFEKALEISTNWDLYEGKNWDPETKFQAAYKDYQIKYDQQVGPQKAQLEQLKAQKAETCSDMKPAVGETVTKLYGVMDVNYTQNVSAQVGSGLSSQFYATFKGSPTQEQCQEADCLHPCYGASHESNCNLCLQLAFVKEVRAKLTDEQAQQICGSCSVPPKEVEIPPMMTYEEFKVYAKSQQK